jgi:hypothetical protein
MTSEKSLYNTLDLGFAFFAIFGGVLNPIRSVVGEVHEFCMKFNFKDGKKNLEK